MARYLLAAEADQIQDLLFRSSRLREVVGGSQLLSQFCSEGAQRLLAYHGGTDKQLIVNDGGAFRIWFTNDSHGRAFGRDLAELYRRCTGGRLTVADELPEYDEADDKSFMQASGAAHDALRAAKNRGSRVMTTAAHIPYAAFCASCGVMVASEHCPRHADDGLERSNYVCRYCLHKATAARPNEEQAETATGFLDLFRHAIRAQLEAENKPHTFPQVRLDFPKRGDWPEALAKLDPRRYVAYLKADGNGMGVWFKRCRTEDQLSRLSAALPRVLRAALAAPCERLRNRIGELDISSTDKNILPVLPLILGGDDLFALLPARWALHFAAEFCRAYEEKILEVLSKEVDLPEAQALNFQTQRPTITAAVLICKANYPYTLAHDRAEELLAEGKRFARRMELKQKKSFSMVNFAVITGNDIGGIDHSDEGDYRATLRPYFVYEETASGAGLALTRLIEQRRALCVLPGKRRAELEALYDISELSQLRSNDSESRNDWAQALQAIIKRLTIKEARSVTTALQKLGQMVETGQAPTDYWLKVNRSLSGSFTGHGLPDLLAAWDFAWSLDHSRAEYQADDNEDGTAA